MTEETAGRKTFTAEEKAEALRLMDEENYTIKQTAEKIGCSMATITLWKMKAKKNKRLASHAGAPVKRRRKASRKSWKRAAKESVKESADKGQISSNEFVLKYWENHPGMTVSSEEVQRIHETLHYAYTQLR